MFLAKSLHTAAVIVALLLSLAMVGCPPPSGEGEGEGEWGGDPQNIMLPDNVRLEMVWIPAGTFMMGRYPGEQGSYDWEDPQHQVTVPGFWMGKYELTKRQWQAVMGTTPWSGYEYVGDDLDSPAVWVSWDDAKAFITELNTHTGLTFRLPSEAEWEYACRADTTTRFYWGDDPDYTLINDYAWWYGNAGDANEQYAHVVGLKLPNAFGLHDMSGNVYEWCEDDWHSSYTGAPADGSAWVDSPRGSDRMIRGGCWGYYGSCRSAYRIYYYHYGPSDETNGLGFRLAR
ncbi:MAG: formylglycine-generating enzyme family protein [Candidatus Hydrogenedentes bacterium]|nr:formylglycine-generating enzyme family protein [Candidatus Hydrogenedentota bacterium]